MGGGTKPQSFELESEASGGLNTQVMFKCFLKSGFQEGELNVSPVRILCCVGQNCPPKPLVFLSSGFARLVPVSLQSSG